MAPLLHRAAIKSPGLVTSYALAISGLETEQVYSQRKR